MITTLESGFDLNLLEKTGKYIAVAPTNGPTASRNYFVDVVSANVAGHNYVWQTLIDVDTNRKASRTKKAAWTAWNVERERLTEARTYHVSTAGDDTTGDGSEAAPWATLIHAVSHTLDTIDPGPYGVTIQLAAGTYTAPFIAQATHSKGYGGDIIIKGDPSDASLVVLSPNSADYAVGVDRVPVTLALLDLTIQTAIRTVYCTGYNSKITLGVNLLGGFETGDIIISGAPGTNGSQAIFLGVTGGDIVCFADTLTMDITGSMRRFINAAYAATLDISPSAFVNLNAVTLTTAGIAADTNCRVVFFPGDVTLTGAYTGKRYALDNLSILLGASIANTTFGATAGTATNGSVAVF